jgi:hypothetical protein
LVLGSQDLIAPPTQGTLGAVNADGKLKMLWQLALTLSAAAAVLSVARRAWVSRIPTVVVIAATFFGTVALAYSAAAIWPNGDEYAYLYVARTLLDWRTYNPPPPVPELFDFLVDRDTRRQNGELVRAWLAGGVIAVRSHAHCPFGKSAAYGGARRSPFGVPAAAWSIGSDQQRACGSRNGIAVHVIQRRLFVQSHASGRRGDGDMLVTAPGRGQ